MYFFPREEDTNRRNQLKGLSFHRFKRTGTGLRSRRVLIIGEGLTTSIVPQGPLANSFKVAIPSALKQDPRAEFFQKGVAGAGVDQRIVPEIQRFRGPRRGQERTDALAVQIAVRES